MRLLSELFGVVIMMQVIALPIEARTNKVAEMQLNFWREKLPNVQVPETVAASMSPLTQDEVSAFVKIIKDGNLRYHASEFCNAANLLCYQSVNVVLDSITQFLGMSDVDLNEASHLFFSAKELREGGQITLPSEYRPWKAFLPRNLSQLIPFSTVGLSDVVSSFGMAERSNMTVNMNNTLNVCEGKPEQGENLRCTTSIEGMIEFVLSNMGSSDSLQLVSIPGFTADSGKQARVRNVVEKLSGPSNRPPLSCHRLVYPYGGFYCHSVNGTWTFNMELEVLEKNGNIYNAIALCHPHAQVQVPVYCHLIFGDTLLWLTKDKH